MADSAESLKLLVDFFHRGSRMTYEKGEFLVRPGEHMQSVFLIEDGLVKSYDITKYGEENLLVIRGSDDLLGLTKALAPQDNHPVMYAAIAHTVVWQQPTTAFLEFLEEEPLAALPLVRQLAEMYRVTSERVLNLEYRSVRERLISFLIGMSRRFGEKIDDGSITIAVPLRQQDIASSISATRETTGRELAALERKALITSQGGVITIHDMPQLQAYLES